MGFDTSLTRGYLLGMNNAATTKPRTLNDIRKAAKGADKKALWALAIELRSVNWPARSEKAARELHDKLLDRAAKA